VRLALYSLVLLVFVEERLLSGWSPLLDIALVPLWIGLLVGYFVWAPRLLSHKQLAARDLLPGAILTALGLIALMFVSSVAMAKWVDSLAGFADRLAETRGHLVRDADDLDDVVAIDAEIEREMVARA
jgi:hypothetical protein